MSETLPNELLDRLSEEFGVDREYWDIWGRHHEASVPTKAAILASLGLDTSTPHRLRQSADAWHDRHWTQGLPAVQVTRISEHDPALTVSLPVAMLAGGSVTVRVRWEGGDEEDRRHVLAGLTELDRQTVGQVEYVALRLPLPGAPRLGYHDVEAVIVAPGGASMLARCRLIVAPDRAWLPDSLVAGGRMAGLAVSLFGVRSESNWGIGDFADLRRLVRWAATELGVSYLGLNPLHILHNREPYNISPYLPLSAYFRNWIYLNVEAVEDFALCPAARRLVGSDEFQSELAGLRAAGQVVYEEIARMKRGVLRLLFRRFLREEWNAKTARAAAFEGWRAQQGELLQRFSLYCALDEVLHARDREVWIWQDWPSRFRSPDGPAVQEFIKRHRRTMLFHEWLQWQTDLQLEAAQAEAKAAGMALGLYHDLALATDKCGADLWGHASFYANGCRVGSPPDGFAPEGQDWAFPPPATAHHRENGYRLFVESIRKNARHGGALRIDHFMRFFRLFWIPDGMPAIEGTYVNERWQELFGILALESVRNRFLVVGEDLGTVPPALRDAMESFGILSYRLFYFEKGWDGEPKRVQDYARQALVSSTTHDLPTLAGFWAGSDIEARRGAGLLTDDGQYRQQLDERRADKARLLDALIRDGFLPPGFPREAAGWSELTGELHNAVIGYLASTPSMLLLLNQEDLTKETEQQNLPGTTWQYPNWKRKMRFSLEDLESLPSAGDFARMFRGWLQRSGRLNQPPSAMA